ncbi:MAG: lamin tail domain-containing protein [Phycisphaerae bacterium]|nr:lamin tail domain-containing protein [Phycisphaerae bacterium]
MLRFIRILLYSLILSIALPGLVEAEGTLSLVINEFMASNNSSARDPQGQYEDWIEIYNFGSRIIDIGGFYLTDNLSIPTQWRIPDGIPTLTTIPAFGYLLIWADNDTAYSGLHANFKLDAGGEQIALFDSDGITLIDEVVFGQQTADLSSGRYPNASDNWQFLDSPSPGGRNISSYSGQVADLKFSHKRGFYETPFSVTIATETKGAVIYYTLDGSEPYDTIGDKRFPRAFVYSGPVPINTTTSLRAIAVKPGFKSTNIDTQTYIFLDDVIRQPARPAGFPTNWGHAGSGDFEMDPQVVNNSLYRNTIKDDLISVPTFLLVMDIDDWFGSKGIYINESQDGTERVASFEYIDPNSGDEFQSNCAIAMQGGVSGGGTSLNRWKTDKLSMRPRFKTHTDDGTPTGGPPQLNYRFFSDSPTDRFDTIVFDAVLNHSWLHPGSDQRNTVKYIQDQYVADLHNVMGGHSPNGSYAHVYINKLYWGMYYVHERPDDSWAAETFGGDKEEYDAIKHSSGGVVNSGIGGNASANYNSMVSAANAVQSDPANKAKYEALSQKLDIDDFITYLLANWFCGNHDWPQKNWYATHHNHPDGRWRFHSWDAEHTVEGGNDVGKSPNDIHNKLKGNAEYRLRFVDHIHRYFFNDGVLSYPNTANMYRRRMTEIGRAIVGESARWGDNRQSTPYTREDWMDFQNNNVLSSFFPGRSATVLGWLKNAGLYPNVAAPVFHINGSYKYGGLITPSSRFSMTSTNGTIYYTVDGSDPHLPQISPDNSISTILVTENAAKRALVPTSNISSNWRGSGVFNDSAWRFSTGNPGGVGYERSSGYQNLIKLDLEDQMYRNNSTCYIRIPFIFNDNSDDFDFMTLNIRYDDGFIAYINGVEVTRRNFTGTPTWNSSANSSRSDSLAVDFEDIDVSAYLNSLQAGFNILAIHGLNTSTTSSDFLILPELVVGKRNSPVDGGTSPGVLQYTGTITLNNSTHIKARVLSGGTWSALNEATFAIDPVMENLRITEIMYNPADPNTEYVELQNVGAGTINLNLVKFTNGIDFTFPNLGLVPNEYVVIVQDRQAFETRYGTAFNIAGQYSGRLNDAGERIKLEDAIGQVILDFDYKDGWRSITDGDGFSLTVIDPANTEPYDWNEKDSWRASAYLSGSPGEDDSGIVPEPGAVVINEVLAHSHADAADWIELHNTTGTAIDIGGWFLSDSSSDLMKYRIATGTVIVPDGYIVFYEDQHFNNPSAPGAYQPFALSENGEQLYLSSAEGGLLTGYREVEDFGGSETGVSFGRYYKSSTGNYNFVPMSENTPGLANAYPKVGPIVINEIMYNPSWPVGGSYTNDQYEYIELHNISNEPVSLYNFETAQPWKFTDGIDFIFPADVPVMIPAGGYLLVVKDPEAFAWRYPAVPVEKILGPYGGSLNNAGERLELSMPGDVDESGTLYYIRVDRVTYSDGVHPENSPDGVDHWPTGPNDGNKSLTRKVSSDYGNVPGNWTASAPSPGE